MAALVMHQRTRGESPAVNTHGHGRVLFGVEGPLLLQFSIALFTGLVAATFVPSVRRSIPRFVEVLFWIGLVVACTIALVSISDPNARELSASAAWGVDQLITTLFALLLGGVVSWFSENRFVLATWLVIAVGVDVLVLILRSSMRSGMGWQPRVRLGEWMEFPVQAAPARPAAAATDPLAGVNRRIAATMALIGATVLAKVVLLSIWIRDVAVPREAKRLAHAAGAGRVESRARRESLSDATAHLQFAARAWFAAAGEPAVNSLAVKATAALRTARAARRGLRPPALRPGQVIDIKALRSAQSIGWYGPLSIGPTPLMDGDDDAEDSQRSDRLAS
jgi:hypothetical protein